MSPARQNQSTLPDGLAARPRPIYRAPGLERTIGRQRVQQRRCLPVRQPGPFAFRLLLAPSARFPTDLVRGQPVLECVHRPGKPKGARYKRVFSIDRRGTGKVVGAKRRFKQLSCQARPERFPCGASRHAHVPATFGRRRLCLL